MKFLTNTDCNEWCKSHNVLIGLDKLPEINANDSEIIEFSYPNYTQFIFLAHLLSSHSLKDNESLLWVTQTDIWKSSENLHLYYKLRQSYSDQTLISGNPGHLFFKNETEDLKSFLHLSLLFGWDCYLLSAKDLLRIFCSHDEFIKLSTTDSELIKSVNKSFSNK